MMGWRAPPPGPDPVPLTRSHWSIVKHFLPFFWEYRYRAAGAVLFMLSGKVANMCVPLAMRGLVDTLDANRSTNVATVPIALIIAYGTLRLSSTLFSVLRDLVFVRATQGAAVAISTRVFNHMMALGLRFHLERRTGNVVRDVDRGLRGISVLVSFSLYNIVPTLVEFFLVLNVLAAQCGSQFVAIALVAMISYFICTWFITQRSTKLRRQRNTIDSEVGGIATDALLNYETVKYFNNSEFERTRYENKLHEYLETSVRVEVTLSGLSAMQQVVVASGLIAMLWLAAARVASGAMSIGELVMVSSFMLQLYGPLGSLGMVFRQVKSSATDLEKLIVLMEAPLEIEDSPLASELVVPTGEVHFSHVSFAYDKDRSVLHDVDFKIGGGQTVAVVGPSGAGKSTLARLLFRFYDVQQGSVRIDGQDVRSVTQRSLHAAVGIVPQDAVLFNETVGYNINYGRPEAEFPAVTAAAAAAQIHSFISRLPKGYGTVVGERGLKLSGGEKQRVAAARTLLKNPPILVFDEATSALDSANERALQAELAAMARGKTCLVIAHRLSTIMHADLILVMQNGRIVERGKHAELLTREGGVYREMWELQQKGYQPEEQEGVKEMASPHPPAGRPKDLRADKAEAIERSALSEKVELPAAAFARDARPEKVWHEQQTLLRSSPPPGAQSGTPLDAGGNATTAGSDASLSTQGSKGGLSDGPPAAAARAGGDDARTLRQPLLPPNPRPPRPARP